VGRLKLSLLAMVIAILAAPSTARCQSVADGGQWTALFSQGDFDVYPSPLKWWFDGHLRLLDDTDGLHQSIIRPGVGWSLSEDLAAWAGYGWIHTVPVTGNDFDEHRIWQQLTWSRGNEVRTLALRPRLEQRFLETGDDMGWRFRQLVRMQYHLPDLPRLSFVAWDEIFFHLNDTDWGAASGFDQNRAFVGFGWKHQPSSPLRTEIGYLNQTINTPAGADRVNHILSVNFYY
jgi:hypothetical protein